MSSRFIKQTAIVSGGADGLGKGIALQIAEEGGNVVLMDNNPEKLDEAVAEFKAEGYPVLGVLADVSQETDVKKVYEQAESIFGQIHVMVNCAGIVGPTSTKITDYSSEDFDRLYQVNQKGTYLMTKYAIFAMEKHR